MVCRKNPSRLVAYRAECAGCYLRQKPVGGVRQAVSPTLPFPLSLPSPFHPPKFSDKPVGGKVRSSEGEVPRLPPTNTTLRMCELFVKLYVWLSVHEGVRSVQNYYPPPTPGRLSLMSGGCSNSAASWMNTWYCHSLLWVPSDTYRPILYELCSTSVRYQKQESKKTRQRNRCVQRNTQSMHSVLKLWNKSSLLWTSGL